MTTSDDNTNSGARLRVVLWEPQDPLNIGSVIRVCRNCGIDDLRLVRPASFDLARMTITAPHSAAWIEQHVAVFDSFGDAIEGTTRAWALTARSREERTGRSRLDAALDTIAALPTTADVAFVFGREDSGLPNAIVERCGNYVTLETSAEYPSLNLAQAVLLVVHRHFVTRGNPVPLTEPARHYNPAPLEQIDRMMRQAEQSLDAIGFFKGSQRTNVINSIRRVFLRAELDTQELATLWGMFKEIERAATPRSSE